MRIILRNKIFTLDDLETLTNKDVKIRKKDFYIHVLLRVAKKIELVELRFEDGRVIYWTPLNVASMENNGKTMILPELFKYLGQKKWRNTHTYPCITTKLGEKQAEQHRKDVESGKIKLIPLEEVIKKIEEGIKKNKNKGSKKGKK